MSTAVLETTPLPLATKPKRMQYGDTVRILGTVAVVVGHVADLILYGSKPFDPDATVRFNWHVCNWVDAFTRWAVPAYIMLSGALLLDPNRSESPATFYRKRVARIGVPLVFWSLFFMWFSVNYTGWKSWDGALHELLLGKPYTHLHFIFRIAVLYAFTPMIRVYLRHVTRPMLWATVGICLLLAMLDSLANGIAGTELSAFMRFAPFVGYYLCGYLLKETRISRAALVGCWLGFFATVAILALGTEALVGHYVETGALARGYPSREMILYDFVSPVRVLMAVFVWLIFVNTIRSPWPANKILRSGWTWLASATLGIYLVHPLFRELIWTVTQMPANLLRMAEALPAWTHVGWLAGKIEPEKLYKFNTWLWEDIRIGIAVCAVLIYIPSILITALLMKIPLVRRVVD